MISEGTIQEIDDILALTRACGKHMRENGIDQWDENYPDIKTLERDILANNLFVFEKNDVICGIIVLNEEQDKEYEEMDWENTTEPYILVHRLAVNPKVQRQGIASQLMDFAENYAFEFEEKMWRDYQEKFGVVF